MENVLDNPAWSALISGNKHFANGTDEVKYFDKEVSPFFGFAENTPDSFQKLYDLVPHTKPLLFVTIAEVEIPKMWKVIGFIKGLQMVCDSETSNEELTTPLIPLTDAHIPQMLELTKLTNPGPFAERTIDFGHYHGVFNGEKLVAMAGQRLHPFEYAEVSAVCTHPDYTGKGYARQLLLHQIRRIKAASHIPFLHVRHDNDRAVKLYEGLGFSIRKYVYFYVLHKV